MKLRLRDKLFGFLARYLDSILHHSGIVKDLRKNFEIMISSGSRKLDDHQIILNILSKLKPQTTSTVKLKQIGNGDDGTYIIHQQNNVDVLLTAGVGDDISFELNFASMYPNRRFVLLDHTVPKLPKKLKNSTFLKMGLGVTRDSRHLTLQDLFIDFDLNDSISLVLKIDIEGFEYSVLDSISIELLSAFDQVIIEFHDLDGLMDKSKSHKIERTIDNLLSSFTPIFTKANNYGGFFACGQFYFPKVIEVTLVNRKFMLGAEPNLTVLKSFNFRNNPFGIDYSL